MAIRRTKILATLGPATDDPKRLDAMVAAGMDGGRINCAHDTPDAWRRRANELRAAATRAGRPLALLLDLAGPKMRLGTGVRPRQVTPGESVVFASGEDVPSGAVPVDWPGFAEAVSVGRSEVVIGDGTPRFRVVAANPAEGLVTAVCQRPGAVAPRKGIFCTYVATPAPVLSERDLADLEVGVEMNADLVALSFVRSGQDVRRLRGAMDALGSHARVIAKIEKVEAYEALDEIVDVSDGVMVARGDLGVEAGVARVPLIQKDVIRRAGAQGKLVITATQMLESMIEQPEPTRAEATDVANAILDGTSAVMLSGETTVGRYPVEAVEAMASIATRGGARLPGVGRRHVPHHEPPRGGDAGGRAPGPAGRCGRPDRLDGQRRRRPRRRQVPPAPARGRAVRGRAGAPPARARVGRGPRLAAAARLHPRAAPQHHDRAGDARSPT